jgi:nitroreductase
MNRGYDLNSAIKTFFIEDLHRHRELFIQQARSTAINPSQGVSSMSLSATEVHELKQAPSVEGVLPIILHRWSPRSFADKAVSAADLEKVFEAARWTASSYNEQPWRYFVGIKGDATYEKIYSTLVSFNQYWAKAAPVLILGVASTIFAHNGEKNTHCLYDLGAASSYLTLQAAALGLSTHSMAGFDQAAALAAFEVPSNFVAGAVIALGYQGEPADLGQEQMIAMEQAPRQRKPVSEFVFSSWGVPAKL